MNIYFCFCFFFFLFKNTTLYIVCDNCLCSQTHLFSYQAMHKRNIYFKDMNLYKYAYYIQLSKFDITQIYMVVIVTVYIADFILQYSQLYFKLQKFLGYMNIVGKSEFFQIVSLNREKGKPERCQKLMWALSEAISYCKNNHMFTTDLHTRVSPE